MEQRILVIDDDSAVRKSFQLALEDSEYHVDTAESGETGLELFNTRNYQLIFLDLKMPGMNGVETLQEIRKKDIHIPVYIVTAFHEEFFHELKTASQKGIGFELLRKPIGNDDITLVTRSVLNG